MKPCLPVVLEVKLLLVSRPVKHSTTWMRPLYAWEEQKSPFPIRFNSKNVPRRKKKTFFRQPNCCCNKNLRRGAAIPMERSLTMPKLGATMTEGTVLRWLYRPGDRIIKGEPLLEVMTDKVNIEVEAPVNGRLMKILAHDGDVLPIGAPLALLDDTDMPNT